MSRLWVLLRRELGSQFLSPTCWALLPLVGFIPGVLFRWVIIPSTPGDILYMSWRSAVIALWIQIILVPLQTMLLIADE